MVDIKLSNTTHGSIRPYKSRQYLCLIILQEGYCIRRRAPQKLDIHSIYWKELMVKIITFKLELFWIVMKVISKCLSSSSLIGWKPFSLRHFEHIDIACGGVNAKTFSPRFLRDLLLRFDDNECTCLVLCSNHLSAWFILNLWNYH